ncbi:YceI family protein [Marinitenerispora sediminis]|uniref:Polyisoprenoid-binding protein n=1 Tax=Marinitenerispora sediminis TaxID=1931232 RepID=A0A368T4K8_9ACTN|nr:YceI family protein [Marinitenerispora sediminis]RCV56690.1 polyisoprenoid-binding protein [Marinitenerispora sediminis]RCV58455.1 polyisoprenoid-binding protein [Marinitenerispora sediminis]RCV61682.1 polyisoprenoid-binding protein [Marinitenerispora sediminis]
MSEQTLTPGIWKIDPAHSEVGFSVRHMMISKVRGRFETFDATLTVTEDPAQSSVSATIDASSINTNQQQRDDHIRSADFFDVAKHPEFSFVSTGLAQKGEDIVLSGDLTIKGNTRPVELALEFNGATVDPWGQDRAGFHATTEISRKEFGVDIEMPMDGGGVVVGDKISIVIEAEFTRQAD